jgi:hypothetical protein
MELQNLPKAINDCNNRNQYTNFFQNRVQYLRQSLDDNRVN